MRHNFNAVCEKFILHKSKADLQKNTLNSSQNKFCNKVYTLLKIQEKN